MNGNRDPVWHKDPKERNNKQLALPCSRNIAGTYYNADFIPNEETLQVPSKPKDMVPRLFGTFSRASGGRS